MFSSVLQESSAKAELKRPTASSSSLLAEVQQLHLELREVSSMIELYNRFGGLVDENVVD